MALDLRRLGQDAVQEAGQVVDGIADVGEVATRVQPSEDVEWLIPKDAASEGEVRHVRAAELTEERERPHVEQGHRRGQRLPRELRHPLRDGVRAAQPLTVGDVLTAGGHEPRSP